MKTFATVLCSLALALSFSSCALLKGKYDRNEKAAVAYLADKNAPAKINVEGLYYSPQWGLVILNQSANGKVDGLFQDYYHAQGVVSGRTVFLNLRDDDWVEYTAQIKRKNADELVGRFSPSVPFSDADAHDFVLKRISL